MWSREWHTDPPEHISHTSYTVTGEENQETVDKEGSDCRCLPVQFILSGRATSSCTTCFTIPCNQQTNITSSSQDGAPWSAYLTSSISSLYYILVIPVNSLYDYNPVHAIITDNQSVTSTSQLVHTTATMWHNVLQIITTDKDKLYRVCKFRSKK